ncbi:hypothetical protein [Pseudaestuariivita rosea]|uniref:hypothetical protein n=1 Tax=Pseudaestuariivita rosea TaxID=2763263 RepID=UPI001ABA130A|nr:hypothetical protein [Pseudaestuariivita rosea]
MRHSFPPSQFTPQHAAARAQAARLRSRMANRNTAPGMGPLSCEELISNEMLRDLAKDGPDRARGVISQVDQAILAMVLPDLCGELLARRAAMAKD